MPASYEMLELQLQATAQALATARRDLQATGQALSESRAESAHKGPMSDAGHVYCAEVLRGAPDGRVAPITAARRALLAVHRATTPSQVPSSHVIVERAHLEWLQRVADSAGELVMANTFDEGSRAVSQLRDELNGVR